jgi:dipeptidyl-peptidase-4
MVIIMLLYLPVYILSGQESHLFTLEEIFLDQRFAPGSDGISAWMPDGNGIIKVNPGNDRIYVMNVTSGIADTLVNLKEISERVRPNARLGRYFLSEDGKMILFEVTERSGNKSSLRYFFKNMEPGRYSEMVVDIAGKRLLNPAFSPDKKYISYICESDIYIFDIRKGKSERLTTAGSNHIINGNSTIRFDPVINMPGYKWSPDSRKIAFIRFDTEKVGVFKMINNTDSLYPRIIEFQHVKPGETLPVVRLVVKNIDDGSEVILCEGPSGTFSYVTWFGWVAKNELLVKQLNRNQNNLNIVRMNVITGDNRIIWSDRDDAFLMPFDMVFTAEGRSFLTLSEKGGWRRLYAVDTQTGEERCLTGGDYDIESIEGIDKDNQLVYFIASPDNAIYRYLYRVSLNSWNDTVRISPGQKGVHTYDVAPNGKYAFHSYSAMDTPPVTTLEKLQNQQVVTVLQDNHRLKELLSEKLISKTEFIKIDIGNNIALDAWMIKPPDFDPSKKYPLITYVYSMPASAIVRDAWLQNNYLWFQLLAQKGFIVMNIDSRGTPSLYGRDWRKVIYLKHGILPSDEQALAVKKIIRDYPFVDSSRIGIYGWSGGGLVSLLQILRYPDIYKVAIPGAYISNHLMYQAGFTERFLGLPQDNPEAYDLTAAVNYVGGLKGDLLLIHGTGDDNVHYQNTELLINKLVDERKRFFVIPYPNISHEVKRDPATYYHLFDTYLWFFTTRLAGTTERMND